MIDEEFDFTDSGMLRKKAEEKLKAQKKNEQEPMMEVDMKKLLHELQVHQVELEMQNEELKQAYEMAETSLKKYTMLYDLAPMGYFTLDQDGSICDLNFTGAELLKDRRFSLINSNFKLFITEDSLPVFDRFFSKLYDSNRKESCELMLGYDKNPLCYVYMEGIVTGEDRKCLLSVIDITSFKKHSFHE